MVQNKFFIEFKGSQSVYGHCTLPCYKVKLRAVDYDKQLEFLTDNNALKVGVIPDNNQDHSHCNLSIGAHGTLNKSWGGGIYLIGRKTLQNYYSHICSHGMISWCWSLLSCLYFNTFPPKYQQKQHKHLNRYFGVYLIELYKLLSQKSLNNIRPSRLRYYKACIDIIKKRNVTFILQNDELKQLEELEEILEFGTVKDMSNYWKKLKETKLSANDRQRLT